MFEYMTAQEAAELWGYRCGVQQTVMQKKPY